MMFDRCCAPGPRTPCSSLASARELERNGTVVMSLGEEGHTRKKEKRENEWTQQQHGCTQQRSMVSSFQLGTSMSFLKHPRHFSTSRVSNPFFKLSTLLKLGSLSLCFERVSAVLICATFYTLQVWDPPQNQTTNKAKENQEGESRLYQGVNFTDVAWRERNPAEKIVDQRKEESTRLIKESQP